MDSGPKLKNINAFAVKIANDRIVQKAQEYFTNDAIKIAWLLRAITFIDLTTLSGDDTCSNVTRLCKSARNPLNAKNLSNIGFTPEEISTAAVCVYPGRIIDAKESLKSPGSDDDETVLPIAAVATGFPVGQYYLTSRLKEIDDAVNKGAREIDIVIDRSLVICGKWTELFKEIKDMKVACGRANMKTILAVGELPELFDVYKTSMVAMDAGTDFIKTSTGKETVNATIPVGIVMARAIKDYYAVTNRKVGLKAAGGVKTAQDALEWMVLVYEELGPGWLNKDLFRIGASSLLESIEAELRKLIEKNSDNSS